jgi:hypothetical protein
MIYSYVSLTQYEKAVNLLTTRIRNDDAWRNDPVFVKAYDYLRKNFSRRLRRDSREMRADAGF